MRKLELLAPGGDIESIKAAIVAGADAVYCGLNSFNARTRAENLSFEDLHGLLRIAHKHNCQLFLTLNIIVLESELPALLKLLNQLVNTAIDGVIVQDLGLFYLLKRHYPTLDIHASTQVTTHNTGQLSFLGNLGASRANLSRELSLSEIKLMSDKAHSIDMLTEVFVHGSNCIGFSGLCYFSSAHGGNSGNRGRCSQPCRDQYQTTNAGAEYPLNLKDNSAFADLDALYAAGADSLKVEGRIKKSHYVFRVIETWRKQISRLEQNLATSLDKTPLYTVFNRDFSNGYLHGAIGKNMYIDNPRDNAVQHFSHIASLTPITSLTKDDAATNVKKALYDEKTQIITTVGDKISKLSLDKPLITLSVSGQSEYVLSIKVKVSEQQYSQFEAPEYREFTVCSVSNLMASDKYGLTHEELSKRFQSFNNIEYQLNPLCFDDLGDNLFVPFKELTEMKRQITIGLNRGREPVEPVTLQQVRQQLAALDKQKASADVVTKADKASNTCQASATTSLSILIANRRDLALYRELKQQNALLANNAQQINAYYLVPDAIEKQLDKLVWLFKQEPELTPWFGAVIMENDLIAAQSLLRQVKPKHIVTNNSGVGVIAKQLNISWIAGPYLNTSNSISLYCLQQQGCSGAFLSNELNKKQLKAIKAPHNFSLHYSIYHPIMLMSSRQCLFLQSSGCDKTVMDDECLTVCKKSTSLTNIKGVDFVIDKKRSEHNALYGNQHFYNPQVLSDLGGKFDSVLFDLRAIETNSHWQHGVLETLLETNKQISSKVGSEHGNDVDLANLVRNTTRVQYLKGL
ncbi:peptidase U32 family protein [Shewanella pneumatophori]|uniref:U32 family peptidase n=1 Tax=Shewanella pneumatophori TaxID=314092 RepID=A0A9X2CCV1_9GAMM|nr:peptidase U32 family protein [Shewanella pneumatophori]MCL1137297.1 U32 family peptidase [Shewanella pneumatophori]